MIGRNSCRQPKEIVDAGQLGNSTAKAHVVQLALHGSQAGLNVSEAFTVCELREAQTQKLIPAREPAMPGIAAIAAYASLKLIGWRMRHHLRENGPAKVHTPLSGPLSGRVGLLETPQSVRKSSNRKISKHELSDLVVID